MLLDPEVRVGKSDLTNHIDARLLVGLAVVEETTMITNEAFYKPVAVSAGYGKKRDIRTLSEMHDFLSSWPCVRISLSYEVARRACSAARAGHLTVEQARRALATFAQSPDVFQAKTETRRASKNTAKA